MWQTTLGQPRTALLQRAGSGIATEVRSRVHLQTARHLRVDAASLKLIFAGVAWQARADMGTARSQARHRTAGSMDKRLLHRARGDRIISEGIRQRAGR